MLKFIKDLSPRKQEKIKILFDFYQEQISFWFTHRNIFIKHKALYEIYKKKFNKFSKEYFRISKYIEPAIVATIANKLEA